MVRAFALACLLGLIGLFVTAHFGAVDDDAMQRTQAYQFIGRVGDSLAQQVRRIVKPAVLRTEKIARSPRTLHALEAGPEALLAYANELIETSGEIDTLAFYDASGEILAINTVYPDGRRIPDERVERVLARDFTERRVIQNCLTNEVTEPLLEFQTRCDITPAYFDSIGLSIASSVPILNNGERIGVVSCRLDFSRLGEILRATDKSSFTGLYFVSEEGEYFDEEISAGSRLPPIRPSSLQDLAQAHPTRHGGMSFIETDDDVLACLLSIPGLDTLEGGAMRVLLITPTEWVVAEARAARREHALWVALIAFGLALSGLLFQHARKQRALIREVEDALRVAVEANRGREEFLTNLSHEIRTPMTGVFGYSEQLLEGNLNPSEQRHAIEAIHQHGDLLLRMIHDILDLQSIESGMLVLEDRPFDPRAVAEGVTEVIAKDARKKSLDLEMRVSSTVPDQVRGDPLRFQQILSQLVGNAVKFTAKGEVRVLLGYHTESSELVFEVTDTGIGIEETELAEIFEPFRQGDASVTRTQSGSGLGLSVARQLAQLHGGDLSARSERTKGSTFIGTIRAPRIEATLPTPAKENTDSTPDWADLVVLVAEDGPDNQILIRRLIEKTGAQAVIVENGAEAVTTALSINPDVVLMDIQMPVLDGEAATRELRAAQFDRPIIAVTAHALSALRERYLDAGCSEVVPKPYRKSELYRAITDQLRQSASPIEG